MADLPKPVAARLQRPSWKDSRLVLGVILILVAIVAGAKVVAAADDTVPVYAAAHQLVPGQAVTARDLTSVQVRIADHTSAYVDASHPVAGDTFAVREVRQGELVPATALGSTQALHVKAVTVPVDPSAAEMLIVGSVVDVWVNVREGSSASASYRKPTKALAAAVVARVPTDKGGLRVGAGAAAIQVMVPDDQVQSLIASIDQGAKVTLVPTAGSPLKASS